MAYAFKDIHWSKEINIKKYLLPRSLAEALDMLTEHKGRAQLISGGTDVIPQLRRNDLDIEILVDITRLPHMKNIRQEAGKIIIEGLVTHSQVDSSSLVRKHAEILSKGAGSLGSPQIRNIATVAGNLVSGHPAADTSIPLLALNASVTIVSQNGERCVPLSEFFLDKGKTALNCRREVLTRISFDAIKEDQGSSHLRLSKRRSLTVAVLLWAAVVTVDRKAKVIRNARIAMGPVAATPFRANKTEDMLRGAPIKKETIERVVECISRESNPISNPVWGTAEYKEEIIKVFTKRGLKQALKQAGTPVE